MLFSPNALFNRYVASVLPDLGEDNMQQMTFQEYVHIRLGKLFELEHPFMQMEYILTGEEQKDYKARNEGICFKASFAFKIIIDEYVKMLSRSMLIFNNIKFRGEVLIASQQIVDYFYSLNDAISIPNRMQLVKDWLLSELEKIEILEREKDWVVEESDLLDLEAFTQVYSELQRAGRFTEDSFDDFEQEQNKIAKKIVRKHFKPIRNAVKKLKFIHIKAIYLQLFNKDVQQLFGNQLPVG